VFYHLTYYLQWSIFFIAKPRAYDNKSFDPNCDFTPYKDSEEVSNQDFDNNCMETFVQKQSTPNIQHQPN
jgi:hypothetical protein